MKKVLYVEDDPSNLALVQAILEAHPRVQLLTASLGSIGLELARQQRPDLILLDLHLPDMEGEEFLQRLRALEPAAQIPVVIVSADAMGQPRPRFPALGVAEYLTKPFELDQFEQLVDRFLGHVKEL